MARNQVNVLKISFNYDETSRAHPLPEHKTKHADSQEEGNVSKREKNATRRQRPLLSMHVSPLTFTHIHLQTKPEIWGSRNVVEYHSSQHQLKVQQQGAQDPARSAHLRPQACRYCCVSSVDMCAQTCIPVHLGPQACRCCCVFSFDQCTQRGLQALTNRTRFPRTSVCCKQSHVHTCM
jgi:hypothetical protein